MVEELILNSYRLEMNSFSFEIQENINSHSGHLPVKKAKY